MVYSFQLWRHPNIHYREAVLRLSRCELFCMLRSLSVETEIRTEELGSSLFLTFESRELSPEELSFLAGHSSVTLMAEKAGALLRPLSVHSADAFPEDLPEILKYKGKTNPSFTRMMLNSALSLSPFAHRDVAPLVLDPLCGRGTTLFCALCMGADAVGIDLDRRDLKEASDYFARYLKTAGVKHSLRSFSATVHGSGVPGKAFTFALSKEAWRDGKTGTMTVYEADAGLANALIGKTPANLLAADLPYGVQHAPQGGSRPESFTAFLRRVLPAWKAALRPGAVAALSFNCLTLKSDAVRASLSDAGFLPFDGYPFSDLAHAVEQAVVRDLVFAVVPQ